MKKLPPPGTKVYLAGPMRGYPEFNHPSFFKATQVLTNVYGLEVFNPAQHDVDNGVDTSGTNGDHSELESQGFTIRDAMNADTDYILNEAEALVMLPGWRHSSGARAEHRLAKSIGLPIYGDTTRIMIMGHGRHGKDTAALAFEKYGGYSFTSSSWICAKDPEIVRPWLAEHGIIYTTLEECFNDRHNYRELWKDAIANYNRDEPAKLAKRIWQDTDMYVGIRTRREFEEARKFADLVVYVDASDRLPPEPTFEMNSNDADIVILNNQDERELYEQERYDETTLFQRVKRLLGDL